MATRKIQLDEEQVKELKRYERQSQRPDELNRLQAVRLYGTGHGVSALLDMVGCGEGSLRVWATSYTQAGVAGLQSHYGNSAPNARKLRGEQEQDLGDKLHQYRPDQVLPLAACHGPGPFWTVEDVISGVEHGYGVTYRDASSYRNLLHRCGLSYPRSEQVYKSGPSQVAIADFEVELEKK